jgi:probable HAF family extracellular repeat protein
MQLLGSQPPPNADIRATGISDDGEVIVGFGAQPRGTAFRWTAATGIVGIDNLFGGAVHDAWYLKMPGVSGDGNTVVGHTISANGIEAARWTSASGVVRLGDLPGGVFRSEALNTSANGSVVVGWGTSSNGPEAMRWTATGGMIGLGDLPGGPFESYAYDVCADGSVIVGASRPTNGIQAFYWTEATGMTNLRDLLIANGASNLTGWTLHHAHAVSADGLTIVGNGNNPSGSGEAWIATIPEPSSAALCLMWAFVAVATYRLRLAR